MSCALGDGQSEVAHLRCEPPSALALAMGEVWIKAPAVVPSMGWLS